MPYKSQCPGTFIKIPVWGQGIYWEVWLFSQKEINVMLLEEAYFFRGARCSKAELSFFSLLFLDSCQIVVL